jgi:hypothetical protein
MNNDSHQRDPMSEVIQSLSLFLMQMLLYSLASTQRRRMRRPPFKPSAPLMTAPGSSLLN